MADQSVTETTTWAGSIAAELHRIADDFAKTAVGDLPIPRSISVSVQPGGPVEDADDQVIASVDAIGAAVLGKGGAVIALSGGGFHYRSGGARGLVDFLVFREISQTRVEQIRTGAMLAEKEAELDRLRAEVEKLRANRGLDYSRPVDDPQPVAGREPMHTGAVTEGGLVDETERESIHFDQPDGESFCGLAPTTAHRADEWAKVTCGDCLQAVPF